MLAKLRLGGSAQYSCLFAHLQEASSCVAIVRSVSSTIPAEQRVSDRCIHSAWKNGISDTCAKSTSAVVVGCSRRDLAVCGEFLDKRSSAVCTTSYDSCPPTLGSRLGHTLSASGAEQQHSFRSATSLWQGLKSTREKTGFPSTSPHGLSLPHDYGYWDARWTAHNTSLYLGAKQRHSGLQDHVLFIKPSETVRVKGNPSEDRSKKSYKKAGQLELSAVLQQLREEVKIV